MPIGSTNVYNPGDLILSTVSGSGTSFIETKIIAATSSFILFNSSGTLTSASLNSIVATTSSYVSGSTSIITNLTASNISASGTGSFGMVGIGTTVPSAKLTIVENTNGGTINLVGRTSDDTAAINFRATGDASTYAYISPDTNEFRLYHNDGFMSFYPGGSEKVRITSTGLVGIGTTSPSSSLHVYGTTPTIKVQGSSTASAKVELIGTYTTWSLENQYINGANNDMFRIYNSALSADAITINRATNNVGIGTTSPGSRLEVQFPTNPATDNGVGNNVLRIWTSASFAADVGGAIGLGGTYNTSSYQSFGQIAGRKTNALSSSNAGYLQFATVNNGGTMNEQMRIDASGNVGIGTTSPTANLTVYNSSTPTIDLNTGASISRGRISATSSDLTIAALTSSPLIFKIDTSEKARIEASGNVGIGTTTVSRKLHVYVDTGTVMRLQSSGSNASIEFIPSIGHNRYNWLIGAQQNISDAFEITPSTATNGTTFSTPAVLVASSGNVGIGTTVPVAKLQVNGNVSGSSFTSSISNAVGFLGTSSWAQNVVSASFATTAQTANALNASNTYTIAGLTSAYVDVTGAGTIPTTGIYRPSTKTLGLSADGTLIFKISNVSSPTSSIETGNFVVQSGNFGLGTNSPNNKLDIFGGTGTTLNMSNVDDGNRGGKLTFISSSATGRQFYVGTNSSIYNLVFGIDSIEKARIDTNGNVGIGTTVPTARLHVSGSTIITGSLNVSANITCLSLTETSTEAVKYNILPLPSQLDNVLKLKPVSFNYKANDKHSIGLIAEEVAKIYPEFTSDNNDSISYGKITSVLIQSIKELKTIIDNQQKQIENLIDKLK